MIGEVWAILWELNGIPCVIDSDSEDAAHDLAARLAEQGRTHIHVVPCEPDVKRSEVAARLAKLRLRVAVTEAMGE